MGKARIVSGTVGMAESFLDPFRDLSCFGVEANSLVAGSTGLLGKNWYGIHERWPLGPVELTHKTIWA